MPTKRVMVAPSLAPSAAIEHEREPPFAVYYKDAAMPAGFHPMRKSGSVYYVPFDAPLRVQTSTTRLEAHDHSAATLRVSKDFASFLNAVEESVFDAALQRRKVWFKKELGEDELRAGFKSFLADDTVEVKVADDCVAFDENGEQVDLPVGSRVRCILELTGVCFGRTEFGCMWTLVQAQKLSSPKCLIDPSAGTDFAANFA